jgi:hypothetical protein
MLIDDYYVLSSPESPVTPGAQRPPLPEFDRDSVDPDTGAPLPVYTVLRVPPSDESFFWRGDTWGLTIEGLPYVAGGADGPARNRVLTYFLDRYGRAWEEKILSLYCDHDRYTHISLSPQDSFSAGQSEDDYIKMSVRCRKAGLEVHHLMRSKYYTSDSPVLSDPDHLVERLLQEDAMQVLTPAWEMNYWSPSVCRRMIDHDASLIGTRAQIMLHFYPHYISWQENHETAADFWRQNYGKVDGVLYQCDPHWTAGMMAARITDGLDRLAPGGLWGLSDSGRGHDIWYVAWETIATCQFNNLTDGDGRLADEDIGNLKGYECLCSPGRMTVKGYGNGGRMPDGSRL